ncbi:hypothetical protein M569_12476 [Genlisea aurea]|uniref:Mitochondrial import inner membrane translocase subunit TIM50 n=1 Tax=Genlisea aurea TaxID=192259 RepID=S8C6C4_9LAMI|nr:hypothetical protein M569_12476 [Genlisea aurea]
MTTLIRMRSRLPSVISTGSRRFSSTVAAEPPKESLISSSLLTDLPPPATSEPPTETPTPVPKEEKSSWRYLSYGLVAAFTGGAAVAGYATYAYSTDEVDEKTKGLRDYRTYSIGDDASALDKFKAYATAGASVVPAKLVELYLHLRRSMEEQVRGFTEPTSDKLLPDLHPLEQHVFTIVLDLNETLIYSDWKRKRGWRTFKRPGVESFLEQLAQYYEIVVFSDQINMFVDPVLEKLDQKHCIRYRLARGATRYINGKHYKV